MARQCTAARFNALHWLVHPNFSRVLFALSFVASSVFALAQAPPEVRAPEVRTDIAPGVVYRHLSHTNAKGEPLSIHVLAVDRTRKELSVRAVSVCPPKQQCELHRELPTSMAADAVASGQKVLAVINGDFDEAGLGISVGDAVTDRRIWTAKQDPEPALAILRSGKPVIGTPVVSIELQRGAKRWPIPILNKALSADSGPALFTREYPRSIKPRTKVRAVWIAALSPSLPLKIDSRVRGRVIAKFEAIDELPIPAGTLVVAEEGSTNASPSGPIAVLRVGDRVQLHVKLSMKSGEPATGMSKDVRDVVGGSPIIVHDGKRVISGPTTNYLVQRHPRTAACYSDREIMFFVVDGRQPKLSVGMTLEDLADTMIEQGCREGINTDGGGSSVMAVAASGKPLAIVNSPSDGQERGRGNAWIVVQK